MTSNTCTQNHRFRRFIGVASIFIGMLLLLNWALNQPNITARIIDIINWNSTWTIHANKITLNALRLRVQVSQLSLQHKKKKQTIHIDDAFFHINPLGFFNTKLHVDDAYIKGLRIELPKQIKKEKKEHKKINLAKLILLRHLDVDDFQINGLSLFLGNDKQLISDQISINLYSTILGETHVDATVHGIYLKGKKRNLLSTGSLSINSLTSLSNWDSEFPYINDLSGKMYVSGSTVNGMVVDHIKADLKYVSNTIDLTTLDLMVEKKLLQGHASFNIESHDYDVGLRIPKPLYLPYIGHPSNTIDTAGAIQGSIVLKGQGVMPPQMSGKGKISVSHTFDADPQHPIQFNTELNWTKGIVSIASMDLSVDDHQIFGGGSIDLNKKHMAIFANSKAFPLQAVFNKFNNPHLAKIFGLTDVSANFSGWGKDFRVKVRGKSYNSGWQPIVADEIHADLTVTYDKLTLIGRILSDRHPTGFADLSVLFGKKLKDGTREKTILLNAHLKDHPLHNTLKAFDIHGVANGHIHIHGLQTKFKGRSSVSITDGQVLGFDFKHMSGDIELTREQLSFSHFTTDLFKLKMGSNRVLADITPTGIRFHGDLSSNVFADISYLYDSEKWHIHNVKWMQNEEYVNLSGYVFPKGTIDLQVNGLTDLSLIKPFFEDIRSGTGLVRFDLNVFGNTGNPGLNGYVAFHNNRLVLHAIPFIFENLTGQIDCNGHKLTFNNVLAKSDDGQISLKGWLMHRRLMLYRSDLSIQGTAMHYRSSDRTISLELEGDLNINGQFPRPLIKGDIVIVDGQYKKNFNMIDAIKGEVAPADIESVDDIIFDPQLDVTIKSVNTMEIKNNVGNIWLSININMSGRRLRPVVSGSITTDDGEINYLGLNFDVSRGFIEFRKQHKEPYLEVHADKEVGIYQINLIMHGPLDNLALDLSATSPNGPLAKRDIVSLLIFGSTEEDRQLQNQNGSSFGTSMALTSISGVISQPITRLTHLDVFRLEEGDPSAGSKSRLFLGKDISDRLRLQFMTDLGSEEAVQTVITEYLLTDNLLIRGLRSTDSKHEVSGVLRFRLR